MRFLTYSVQDRFASLLKAIMFSSLLFPILPTIMIHLQSFRSLILHPHLINSSHQKNSPIPAISPCTFLHNQPIAIPRSFPYGPCLLFLLLFLYFLLLLTNLLTFFAMCFQEFSSGSQLSGQFLLLFTYLIMIPYLMILIQTNPTKPIHFGSTLPIYIHRHWSISPLLHY